MSEIYNENYYKSSCGEGYNNRERWLQNFNKIADDIVSVYHPKTVLDAGCAWGYLVEALRNRGVEAYGIDISEYAISKTQDSIKPYCCCQSLSKEFPSSFPQSFDLIVSIEVIEHIYEEECIKVIENLCMHSDTIVISSSPTDILETTHVNVQQAEYWVRQFAAFGFYNNVNNVNTMITPWTIHFYKTDNFSRVVEDYERMNRIDRIKTKKILEQNKDEKINDMQKFINIRDEIIAVNEAKIVKAEEQLAEIPRMRSEMEMLAHAYSETISAFSWKITKPVRMVTGFVKRVLRALRKLLKSLRVSGFHGTLKKVLKRISRKDLPVVIQQPECIETQEYTQDEYVARLCQAIPCYIVDEDTTRLNFVVDSLENECLLGGVATALIIASKFAHDFNIPLRIITRETHGNANNYYKTLALSGVSAPDNVVFYTDYNRDKDGNCTYKLDITRNDIFMATSWWSAVAIKKTTVRKRFFYMIQELETSFYPDGDDHRMCSKIMKDENIDFVVNSNCLYNYFKENTPNIADNGVWFEPAFYQGLDQENLSEHDRKNKLFFYARSDNPSNLFETGINLLRHCVDKGIIDTNKWDVYCAGQDIPEIKFANGYVVKKVEQMNWNKYVEFINTVDLGVSFLHTPHPSYPAYAIACSNGVAVTNSFKKRANAPQCDNIIASDLEPGIFAESIKKAVEIVGNSELRIQNGKSSKIPKEWNENIAHVIKFMGEKI